MRTITGRVKPYGFACCVHVVPCVVVVHFGHLVVPLPPRRGSRVPSICTRSKRRLRHASCSDAHCKHAPEPVVDQKRHSSPSAPASLSPRRRLLDRLRRRHLAMLERKRGQADCRPRGRLTLAARRQRLRVSCDTQVLPRYLHVRMHAGRQAVHYITLTLLTADYPAHSLGRHGGGTYR